MTFIENIRKEAAEAAYRALGESPDRDSFKIEVPPANQPGMLGTGMAMGLAKKMKMNPAVIAEKTAAELAKNPLFTSVYCIKPGYVNFDINPEAIKDEAVKILNGSLSNDSGAGKKVNLEFVSANPVGPLVVVSGRAASYGDSLAKIMKASGYDVTKEFYVNDFGRQMDLFGLSLKERYFELCESGYAASIPEGGYEGEYVKELAQKLLDEKNESLYTEYKGAEFDLKKNYFRQWGLERMVEWQKKTLKAFNVEFDSWFYESSLHVSGEVKEAVDIIGKKGFLTEREGAVWFETTRFGDDKDRVVVKNDGSYTYFASDIAYMRNKAEKRGADMVINILGPDHHGYIKRLESIMEALAGGKEKLSVLILQQVNLIEKGEKIKMSKRKGNIVTLDELIEETGPDAARYFFLMRNYNSHLDFDIELAKEQSDKNPVYYVQYGFARACSIIAHAAEKYGAEEGFTPQRADFSGLEKGEAALLLGILSLPDALKEAAERFSPSIFVQKVFDLVSGFHGFYAANRVVTEDEKASLRRLFIVSVLKKALKMSFEILGISAPEKM